MKRKLLCIVVLAIFTAGLAYSQYVEDTITVNYTVDPPFIDGVDDGDEWATEEFYTIVNWNDDENGDPQEPDPSDFSAKFKLLWDDYNIYFLGVIEDDVVYDMDLMSAASAQDWECDSWEFYIAPTLSKLPSMEEMTQVRLAYASSTMPDNTSIVTNGYSSGGFVVDNFVTAFRQLTDVGWTVEAMFAIEPLAATTADGILSVGSMIGWNMTPCDQDGNTVDADGNSLRTWIGNWIPDTQWDQADTLGILKFGADTTGHVPGDTGNVGIDKIRLEAEINFYPNPVAEDLHFSGNANIETIEIINPIGSMVLRRTNVTDRIDVSDLEAGIYFVKAYSNGSLLETHMFLKE